MKDDLRRICLMDDAGLMIRGWSGGLGGEDASSGNILAIVSTGPRRTTLDGNDGPKQAMYRIESLSADN